MHELVFFVMNMKHCMETCAEFETATMKKLQQVKLVKNMHPDGTNILFGMADRPYLAFAEWSDVQRLNCFHGFQLATDVEFSYMKTQMMMMDRQTYVTTTSLHHDFTA
jgi:hypothetical protein